LGVTEVDGTCAIDHALGWYLIHRYAFVLRVIDS
jgi:hypothetical protein